MKDPFRYPVLAAAAHITSPMPCTTSTLALYNACELLALIFTTFKHRRGLYFWSLLLTTLGVLPYAIGWLFGYFGLAGVYVSKSIAAVGWIMLISGQSVVLYSRLHLVISDLRIQRAVLWMIVVNGTVWHTTQTVLQFTIGPKGNGNAPTHLFVTIEQTQMTFFCVQEFVISGLYLWGTIDILQTSLGNKQKIMWHLLVINLVIVVMDVVLLVIVYKRYYTIEQGVKLVIYSIKLKLEFAVLGKLVDVVQSRGGSSVSAYNPDLIETGARDQRGCGTAVRSHDLPEIVHLENVASRGISDERSIQGLYNDAIKQIAKG
ncbi:hypothetical protein FHETE_6754 [Fusarium heterosporum]|uniref:DUF7703 domain-containing protein n=1 Tax=Fusarium heterosporum TaxID=42747 RepID=A0A8H5T8K4_FUSHE|nr:hypothetical protein FHETE_6754 [Fusarium heterosporum]